MSRREEETWSEVRNLVQYSKDEADVKCCQCQNLEEVALKFWNTMKSQNFVLVILVVSIIYYESRRCK